MLLLCLAIALAIGLPYLQGRRPGGVSTTSPAGVQASVQTALAAVQARYATTLSLSDINPAQMRAVDPHLRWVSLGATILPGSVGLAVTGGSIVLGGEAGGRCYEMRETDGGRTAGTRYGSWTGSCVPSTATHWHTSAAMAGWS